MERKKIKRGEEFGGFEEKPEGKPKTGDETLDRLLQQAADAGIDPAAMVKIQNDVLLDSMLKDAGIELPGERLKLILHIKTDPGKGKPETCEVRITSTPLSSVLSAWATPNCFFLITSVLKTEYHLLIAGTSRYLHQPKR